MSQICRILSQDRQVLEQVVIKFLIKLKSFKLVNRIITLRKLIRNINQEFLDG